MKSTVEVKKVVEFIISCEYNHPMISQACSELSIDQQHLLPKSISEFATDPNLPGNRDLAELYSQHYEARRRAKIVILAKYLLENNYINPSQLSEYSISRSLSSTNAQRPKSSNSARPEQLEILKKSIIKKLNVENNLKKIKTEEENRRKNFENKLYTKSCRNNKKALNLKKIHFEKHDQRVKEILQKKHKNQEEHEKYALSLMKIQKSGYKTFSNSFQSGDKPQTPGKNISRLKNIEINDSIDKQLDEIKLRMEKSAERAKKVLNEKALSGNLLSTNTNKVRMIKEGLSIETEKKNIEKLFKIKKDLMESNKRREELLYKEKKRIRQNMKNQEMKSFAMQKEIEKAQADKERIFEEKSELKEKMKKEIKGVIDIGYQAMSYKAQMRKRDQEMNFNRLQKESFTAREKRLEKIRLTESLNRSKGESDIKKIKDRLEAEIRTDMGNNNRIFL
ncbi:hypothetical protein SteCoe_23062 [Stentor coeruleus]|uniref:Uncharacterized protein n=1 Tax=Stentor coeruleus TaxID=5963 RepID=A0A1R2BKT4_9CILI|nr:hypothetical protein SteCoe_23062 [Stentor coeruleus]